MEEPYFTTFAQRLAEAYDRTLEESEKWDKFERDYKALKQTLLTLDQKLEHPVMIPLGPLAYFEGHLTRTNQVLALLGDNWFTKMTTHDAAELVERRLKVVRETKETLDKQLSELVHRAQWGLGENETVPEAMTDEKENVVDICEPVGDEEVESDRENRRAHNVQPKKTVNYIKDAEDERLLAQLASFSTEDE